MFKYTNIVYFYNLLFLKLISVPQSQLTPACQTLAYFLAGDIVAGDVVAHLFQWHKERLAASVYAGSSAGLGFGPSSSATNLHRANR